MDELWDSMCQTAITLISKALSSVDSAELLLKIKGIIALFIQTMVVGHRDQKEVIVSLLIEVQGWNYSVHVLDTFLLTLFEKYAELLKKRFSDDFQDVRAKFLPEAIF